MSGSPAKVQMLPRQTISLLDNPSTTGSPSSGTYGSPGAASATRAATAGTPSAARTAGSDARTGSAVDRSGHRDDDSDSDVEYVRSPWESEN